jgi:hypothetical protein
MEQHEKIGNIINIIYFLYVSNFIQINKTELTYFKD